MIQDVIKGLRLIRQEPEFPFYLGISGYQGAKAGFRASRNHFIIFLKPESLSPFETATTSAILEILDEGLNAHSVQVGGVSLVSGAYLKKYKIIDQHYGVLNRISRGGRKQCSQLSLARAAEKFGELEKQKIYGGHQFLEHYPMFTPTSLCELNDKTSAHKLGSGTYAIKACVGKEETIILNGFHPFQLESLTGLGTGILVMECWTDQPWAVIRSNFIGGINPGAAALGSFRRTLFERRASLSLEQISIAYNYIHVSPGPLEAMYQLTRFFSDHETGKIISHQDTNFGHGANRLCARDFLDFLEDNPEFEIEENIIPVFDKTEDMDTEACISLVSSLLHHAGPRRAPQE